MSAKELYDLGEMPPTGVVPEKMHAFTVRQDRFGDPVDAWKREVINTPAIGPKDVLVYVMATGINFNNVWAGLGYPVDVIADRQKKGEAEDFHAGGSDASGIVWAVGGEVTEVAVGEQVVVHSGWWPPDDPWVLSGKDPMLAPSVRIWGYQTNYGSYCQFARAQSHQIKKKPGHLTWEQAGCYMLCASTAYRQLMGWTPNVVAPGDVVLVWGAAGGLGAMAIQITAATRRAGGGGHLGRRQAPILPRQRRRRGNQPQRLQPLGPDAVHQCPAMEGMDGRCARLRQSHLGRSRRAQKSENRIRASGRSDPADLGFVCDTGGMVVICAGTTGYNVTMDLRYHWMMQKRFQGSHLANDEQAEAVNELIIAKKVDPCLSGTFQFDEIGHAHQLMYENKHPYGNMACLVNATEKGTGAG